MNYALIIVNVIIFLITYKNPQEVLHPWAKNFMLTPAYPFLWQFISYAFLHGGMGHIFGNMYFLYIFGANVNDRLGNLGYLVFYLAGAVFSALGHILAASLYGSGIASPVLGASGAVAAVTGAYLVLFPHSLITIVYWFFFIGTMELPAIWLILAKMVFIDNIIATVPGVAHDAHLAGYAFGILAMLILLAANLIKPDYTNLWAMMKRWNRRRVYRDVVADDGDPFAPRLSKKIQSKEVKTEAQKQEEEKTAGIRKEILTRINQGNVAAAADLYLELNSQYTGQILPRQPLLDIANQLMSAGKWTDAAGAYEKFLSRYHGSEHSEQVELMLGVIYARYLNDKDKALDHLKKAQDKVTDPGQKKMCTDEIQRLQG